MIRKYKNIQIYKNFKIASIFSLVSVIVSIFILVIYTLKIILDKTTKQIDIQIFLFIFCLIFLPINLLIYLNKIKSPPAKENSCSEESYFNNDLFHLISNIIISLFPLFILALSFLISVITKNYKWTNSWAFNLGYMFISRIFVYICDVFLIHSYLLIKKEWKEDPPGFIETAQIRKDKKNEQKELRKNLHKYKLLINNCGIVFFIKYYPQFSNLPFRDVYIEETYPWAEKIKRIKIAKKIVKSGSTKFVLTKILNEYNDILDQSLIDSAKNILKKDDI